MPSEPERAAGGYLYRVLADGVKSFAYRGRVRALLGFPDVDGVRMNFAEPLPVAGLAYIRSHLAAEYDRSDQPLGSQDSDFAGSAQVHLGAAARTGHSAPDRVESPTSAMPRTPIPDHNSVIRHDPKALDATIPQPVETAISQPDRSYAAG